MAKKKLAKWPIPGRPKVIKKMVALGVVENKRKGIDLCNRSACLAPNPTHWNVGSLAMYCHHCAEQINDASRRFGEPNLCYDVTNVPDGQTVDSFKKLLSQKVYEELDKKQQLK